MESNYEVLEVANISSSNIEHLKHIAFNHFGCLGVEDFNIDEARVDAILGERAYSGGDIPESIINEVSEIVSSDTKYRFYFEDDAFKFKSYLSKELGLLDVKYLKEKVLDWNNEWRKSFQKIEVSKNLNIVPSWELEKKDENSILIYPGQGFGTGNHETTKLCLELFDKHVKDCETCFDFGCGSGILGIAAIKKFNSRVKFCDVDKAALENSKQNLELNFNLEDLEGSSLTIRERLSQNKKYDLVFANILENILILEPDIILDALKKDSILIVSGLLSNQVEKFVEKFKELDPSLNTIEVKFEGDWGAVIFQKK